jgi:type III secretion protein L
MSCADIYEIRMGSFDTKRKGKVLKAASYVALVEAKKALSTAEKERDDILRKAHRESAAIAAEADKKAKEIIERAKQTRKKEEERGYADGLATGKQEISNVMMDFVTKSAQSFSKLEADVTEVVGSALRKIIGKLDKTELITNVVKNSLQKIKLQKQATLKVSPVEAQMLRDRMAEITVGTPVLEFLDVCADAHLEPGSCILETELGVIDASISVQLEAIEAALAKTR